MCLLLYIRSGRAAEASDILREEGIPAELVTEKMEPAQPDPQPRFEHRVMVPGALLLRAASVLDRNIFYSELEADWCHHLAELGIRGGSGPALRRLN